MNHTGKRLGYAVNQVEPPPAIVPQQVSSQISLLGQEIEDNRDIIARLAERLSPILRSGWDSKTEAAGKGIPEENLVPLAETLRSFCRSERNNNATLRDILDAIEL